MPGDPQNPPESGPIRLICENCNTPLDERTGARCDNDGLWFCTECWNALAEDFGLVPRPD